ncbi:MAG: anaerobic ribonucleoside-triphosphate reductase [Chloroflexi bacterium]|nr:anaerobic ribonucleoside-triphosphate reductase [Chloroflexota bacterium]
MTHTQTPFPIIRKRDGRLTKFDRNKISEAIFKAFTATGKVDKALAEELADGVVEELKEGLRGTVPMVEEIQDVVEKILIKRGYAETAKAYILYRAMRNDIREGKSALMDTVEEILSEPLEEAPYRLNSPSAKMLKIASAASRSFYLSRLIPSKYSEAHKNGEIHIHDLDYYGKTVNTFYIPLLPLLKDGFFAGYGRIRPPKRIATAAALSAIILQSCQNDMFGGQTFPSFDRDLAEFASQHFDDDEETTFQAMEGLVYNLNSLYSRVGAQVPLSCINVGTDTSSWGRRITRAILRAIHRGLGSGETPLFPQIIFKVKKGINLSPTDPNYDLFQYAVEVACRRMNPTFSFLDAPENITLPEEVSYSACGGRIGKNHCGDTHTAGRGSLGTVTVNLPRIALRIGHNRSDFLLDSFYAELERSLHLAEEVLLHRFEVVSHLKVRELPFIIGQGLYQGSKDLGPDDDIGPAIMNGTLGIGFYGLAEALVILTGASHAASEASQKRGKEIVKFMRDRIDEFSKKHDLNFVLLTPAGENLPGRFARLDFKIFGDVIGVNDKGYYTNGFCVPADTAISAAEKIKIEAPYHEYTGGGHHTFIELGEMPDDIKAVQRCICDMAESGIGYGGISFKLDECVVCGSTKIENDACKECGSEEIRGIRRVSTFLTPVQYLGEIQKKILDERAENKI